MVVCGPLVGFRMAPICCCIYAFCMVAWGIETGCPDFIYCSISLSCLISCSYSLRRVSLGSSLIFGLFLMDFALEAYLRVDRVSS